MLTIDKILNYSMVYDVARIVDVVVFDWYYVQVIDACACREPTILP